MSQCKSCSTTITGRYCSHCGQKLIEKFNAGYLWQQLHSELFDIDRGLWHTARDLTRRPGHMIREYLGGKTQMFYGPLKYLAIWITVWYALFAVTGVDLKQLAEGMKPAATASFYEQFMGEFTVMMFGNLLLYFLLLIPVLALSLHLFFRSLNTVEHIVTITYLWGHAMIGILIIGGLFSLPLLIVKSDVYLAVIILLSLLVLLGFFVVSYKQLTGGTLTRTALKLLAAVYLGYGVFFVALMGAFWILKR